MVLRDGFTYVSALLDNCDLRNGLKIPLVGEYLSVSPLVVILKEKSTGPLTSHYPFIRRSSHRPPLLTSSSPCTQDTTPLTPPTPTTGRAASYVVCHKYMHNWTGIFPRSLIHPIKRKFSDGTFSFMTETAASSTYLLQQLHLLVT